jgi:hypothetical protein
LSWGGEFAHPAMTAAQQKTIHFMFERLVEVVLVPRNRAGDRRESAVRAET